ASSASHASKRWSGECRVAPSRKKALPCARASPSSRRRPIRVGRGRIVLLDATLHFGKQRFLQAFCVSKRALAIIVCGLQIGEYRRIELNRIAHHFAPVLRLEPGILVDEAEVVEGALKGTLLRLWLGRRARGPRA